MFKSWNILYLFLCIQLVFRFYTNLTLCHQQQSSNPFGLKDVDMFVFVFTALKKEIFILKYF